METDNQTTHPSKSIGSTQCKQVLSHLRSGQSITPLEALNLYGIFRLASRIHDLRNQGVDIKVRRDVVTENGKKVAQYFIA
jgi:hypothetical protein